MNGSVNAHVGWALGWGSSRLSVLRVSGGRLSQDNRVSQKWWCAERSPHILQQRTEVENRQWESSPVLMEYVPVESQPQACIALEHFHYPLLPLKKSHIDQQSSPILPFPKLWKPLMYFMSLWICLFWKCHMNGIIQYTAFCLWLLSLSIMLSRAIHIVA